MNNQLKTSKAGRKYSYLWTTVNDHSYEIKIYIEKARTAFSCS